MTFNRDIESIQEFFREVDDRGRVQLEFEIEASPPDEDAPPRLQLDPSLAAEKLVGESVQVRFPSTEEEAGWLATAEWTSEGNLTIRQVRRVAPSSSDSRELAATHRLSIPPSSLAVLELVERDESYRVEPVDLSLGGIGVWTDEFFPVHSGDRVEVELSISGEFSEKLPGQVAFVDNTEDRARIGVMFGELAEPVREKLRSTLHTLLLKSSPT